MPTTFKIERQIEECDETLYQAGAVADGIRGLGGLTEEAVRAYKDRGFLVVRGAYTPQQAAEARAELASMARLEEPRCTEVDYEFGIWQHLRAKGFPRLPAGDVELTEDERTRLRTLLLELEAETRARLVRKFVGFTKFHPPLGALANDKALMGALAALIGEPARLYVSQAMIKPPGGREKPWHQDHAYFNFPIDTPIVGVWIALDEATAENGCMRVLPGGHAAGPRPHFRRRDWQICDTDMVGQPIVAVPLSAGDALLFDGKLPHGTPANRTNEQRWAVQYHYVPDRAEMIDEKVRLEAFGSEGKNVSC